MKAIVNGKIITTSAIVEGKALLFEDGKIVALTDQVPSDAETIDAAGNYVSPGFIDIHVHGGGGADFMDGSVDAFLVAARMHAKHGTTLIYPTTMTVRTELLYETSEFFEKAKTIENDGATLGGLHLEGPYFSMEKRGAQDPATIRNPKPEEYIPILDRCPGIARWSYAPELEGAEEFAKELTRRGVVASMGHTNAEFDDCERAYQAGAKLMTHFYNCMSTLHKVGIYRYPGAVEYGYYNSDVIAEAIADGIHVNPNSLKTLVSIKGRDGVALITDTMRAAGMPDGPSVLGKLSEAYPVLVTDGAAMLPDKSALAASTATTDRLVRTMVQKAGCALVDAVYMASHTPAKAMGVLDRTGSLEPGKDADILIFDEGINIQQTIVRGRTVYKV